MLLLSALLAPLVVLASWQHNDRPRTYFVLLCLLFTGLFGTFTALNFFHWFLYWELALVPPFSSSNSSAKARSDTAQR